MKPSLATTIAIRNQGKAIDLVNKYGLQPKSVDDIVLGLNQIIVQKGEQGLKQLAMIHPDRDLILSTANSSSCGCSSSCDGDSKCSKCKKHSNAYGADGDGSDTYEPTGAAPSFIHQHQNMILTVVAIVAVIYLLKK